MIEGKVFDGEKVQVRFKDREKEIKEIMEKLA